MTGVMLGRTAALVHLACLMAFAALGCREERKTPAPAKPAKPAFLCPGGHSLDPSRAELEPGIRAFRDRDYGRAQAIFSELAAQYPKSATTLGWYADAILFDKDRDIQQAARDARPIQKRTRELHEAGCQLPRRPLYYLLMGEAYGALRLARDGHAYVPEELLIARQVLEEAAEAFPQSAEVNYNLARTQCALAQVPSEAEAEPHVQACVEQFEAALEIAASLDRPRFLRTHRSVEDWIVRSETQSEFEPLRTQPLYRTIIKNARKKSLAPAR